MRFTRFMTAMAVTGLALVSALGAASTASAAASTSSNAAGTTPAAITAALPFNVNGPWTDNGFARPVITVAANQIVIDMSYAHRPNGVGTVLDASSIVVTFPDADTYIGTFLSPTVLQWSNGSQWQKVFTGAPVIGLDTTWTNGITRHHVTHVNGFLTVDMSELHRPNGAGYVVNASTIRVTFPGQGTYTGALQLPGIISWSNNTQWHEWIDQSPGNPDCLLPHGTFC